MTRLQHATRVIHAISRHAAVLLLPLIQSMQHGHFVVYMALFRGRGRNAANKHTQLLMQSQALILHFAVDPVA